MLITEMLVTKFYCSRKGREKRRERKVLTLQFHHTYMYFFHIFGISIPPPALTAYLLITRVVGYLAEGCE